MVCIFMILGIGCPLDDVMSLSPHAFLCYHASLVDITSMADTHTQGQKKILVLILVVAYIPPWDTFCPHVLYFMLP